MHIGALYSVLYVSDISVPVNIKTLLASVVELVDLTGLTKQLCLQFGSGQRVF